MKQIFILFISFLLVSCIKSKDPFSDIEFGKITEKEFIKSMKSKNVIIPDVRDTTDLTYFLNANGKIFPMQIYINDYHFGNLRKIQFDLGTDTKENDYVCKGCGPISKEDVDIIYNYYFEQYGKPDTLVEKNKYSYSGDIRERAYKINTNQPPSLDKTVPKSKRAVWINKYFKLTINIPFPTKNESKGGKFYYNMPYSQEGDVSITYEMNNYNLEFKRIQDSIRSSLKPNDILELSVSNPKWIKLNTNNYRLELSLNDIKRKDIEEPRSIKGFKYDIVILDSFNEELYRFDNIRTFDINESHNYIEIGTGHILDLVFHVDFNNFSVSGKKLENIKYYMNTNTVKFRADIKKILFEDNTVLQ